MMQLFAKPSREEVRLFGLLVLGHVLFAAVLFAVVALDARTSPTLFTGVYALPLLALGPRDRMALRIFLFVFVLAAVHYLAVWLTVQCVLGNMSRGDPAMPVWAAGAIGGAVGAAGSFGTLALGGLLKPGSLGACAVATVILTAIGALGVWGYVAAGPASEGAFIHPLIIYTPWQLAFAWALARTLRT